MLKLSLHSYAKRGFSSVNLPQIVGRQLGTESFEHSRSYRVKVPALEGRDQENPEVQGVLADLDDHHDPVFPKY